MKTFKKRNIALLTACVVLLCTILCVTNVSAEEMTSFGKCGENLTWTLSDDGTLTISGTGEMYDFDWGGPWSSYHKQIKSIVFEEGVTSIGSRAFVGMFDPNCFYNEHYPHLDHITIGDTITVIRDSAFFANPIESIEFSDSLIEIGNSVFTDTLLSDVTFGSNLKIIGNYAFDCCPLPELNLPDSIEVIGTQAFSNNSALHELDIPEGVTNLGLWAFAACDNLTRVSVPSTVTTMGANPFCINKSLSEITVSPDNPMYCSVDNAIYSKDLTVLYSVQGSHSGTYRVADTVTTIADYAFYSHQWIDTVIFPANVKTIGNSMFTNSNSVTTVIFEGNAPQFSERVFNYASSTTVYYPKNNSTWTTDVLQKYGGKEVLWVSYIPPFGTCGENLAWKFDNGILTITGSGEMDSYRNTQVPWHDYREKITHIIITDNVTTIGSYAFSDCTSLQSVTFGKAVTAINSYAFSGCPLLKEITLNNTVTAINMNAFQNCNGLETAYLGHSLESIGYQAFYNCTNLKSITIPESTVLIENEAFKNCRFREAIILSPSVKFNDNTLICSTMSGYRESTAEEYATRNGISFITLDIVETDPVIPEEVQVEFNLSDASALTGNTVEVILSVNSKTEINSIALYELTYDPEVLTFMGFDDYQDFENDKCAFPNCFDSEKGLITIPLKQSEALTGTVCKLIFKLCATAQCETTKVSMTSLVKNFNDVISSTVTEAKITVRNQLLGDINGDNAVDISDAMLLFQHSMLPDLFPLPYSGNLDFTKDGCIDIADAMLLFQYSMLPDLFPIN